MINLIIDEEKIKEINNIEKSILDIKNFSLSELIKNDSFKNIYFFPEFFLLRFDIIRLIHLNNVNIRNLYIVSHNDVDTPTCIQLLDIDETEWDKLFETDNMFVNLLYSNYTTIFDETQRWLFFHKIDYPNILFCNENWAIPNETLKYLQTFEDIELI